MIIVEKVTLEYAYKSIIVAIIRVRWAQLFLKIDSRRGLNYLLDNRCNKGWESYPEKKTDKD